jgi:hypothetical protein
MDKKNVNNKLSGIYPFSYMGIDPSTPPDLVIQHTVPLNTDSNFNIGTLWLVLDPTSLWILLDLSQGLATWVKLYPGVGNEGAEIFPCNIGTAIQEGGLLNVLGNNIHQTTGSGNTVTLSIINGIDGQTIIGGGGAPAFMEIIGIDGIVITPGPNSIEISSDSGVGVTSIVTDDGTSIPVEGTLQILGDNLVSTSANNNIVTVSLDKSMDGQIPIGATGAATQFNTITSPDDSIFIQNLPNEIQLELESLECCFFAVQLEDTDAVTGDSLYRLGIQEKMHALYNIGNNFYEGDGAGGRATFTAPTDGIYWFCIRVGFYNIIASSQNGAAVAIFTTNTTIPNLKSSGGCAIQAFKSKIPSSPTYLGLSSQLTMQLNKDEVVEFQAIVNSYVFPPVSNPQSVYIGGKNGSTYQTYIGGYLMMAIT